VCPEVTPKVATQGAESAVYDCLVTVFVVPLRLITQYSYGQFGAVLVLSEVIYTVIDI